MFLRLPSRAGTRPPVIYGVNKDSSLAQGLLSWVEPNANGLINDYGEPTGETGFGSGGTATILPNPFVGGSSFYATGGSALVLVGGGTGDVTKVSTWTQRLVFTVMNYPGAFTALLDDPGRTNSAFLNSSGIVTFSGFQLTTVNIATALNPLTAGTRWDIVLRGQSNGGAVSTSYDGWLNGVLMGTGAPGGGSTWDFSGVITTAFGSNPSGGGSVPDCFYECIQQWTRKLTDEEVFRLYNPPTRWDLYWTPSNRTFFHVPAVTTGKTFFLIPN
jgi:hypothetical protein